MAMHIDTQSTAAHGDAQAGYDAPDLRVFVFALFFIFGGITSLNDIIIPKLKELFTLDHATAMLVQSAFFFAYALFSIPAAAIVRKAGYMRTASIGLVTMTLGCLAFIPASANASFPLFLGALFILGAGITIVQVVANPLISLLGKPESAAGRLTFAQGFNSLGTTLFPLIGSAIILGGLATVDPATLSGAALDAYRAESSRTVVHTYIGLAIALLVIAGVVWTRRNRLNEEQEHSGGMFHAFTLLKRPRFAMGTACIFLYVGAEVAIGSLIVNYLMQPSVFGITDKAAGDHVPFYWGGALIGRFIGAYILTRMSPGKVLAGAATGAIALLLISANTQGAVSGWSLLAIGLMNSIMFPTIFSLASEGLGKRAAEGSGVIATAIVGGAVIPYLTGSLADASNSLHFALTLPAVCYLLIAAYGLYARRSVALA
ncbi:FHS family L-fucose permease-like MFS transporter [Sphingomonas sp. SORGH_AS802]|uniref:sugar MFS transporter n=1 Tax=unclassified Sphingomonas TaxID=196159 RepID=UPI00285D9691|nr:MULTISPECIES: sugar MFS transporter [unclassified Sphingomonas]MDR6127195.1 FHS family L-fucose permease-like MFS transporter [Sphingomonas sp. SORGH_AS_0438]MDR6133885.1 FHS family L-fucose permease-like MFS transporter [Sphingomonas sp. SORGH_AS_0802]